MDAKDTFTENDLSQKVFVIGYLQNQLLISGSCKALAAKYRSVGSGLERNTSYSAAVGASGLKELSLGLACILLLVAACLASLGLVLESLLCIESLLTCGKYELLAAVLAS